MPAVFPQGCPIADQLASQETISVGATDLSTKFTGTHYGDLESVYSYSNLGPCVDIFAPGESGIHNPGSTPVRISLPLLLRAMPGQSPCTELYTCSLHMAWL